MPGSFDEIRDQQRDTWDRFSTGWRKWDELVLGWLAPFGDAMLRLSNLRNDAHVLDVAAGTGEPGLTAAAMLPHGNVTVTDLSERMLAVAAENAARRGLTNFKTKVCDANALPFPNAGFDSILCRFGFMFFPDMALAAREFARVAKPGARVCAAVWSGPENNPWATTIMSAITRHVDIPASPPGSPGLFRCAPSGLMRATFEEAGLTDLSEEEVSSIMTHESPERYWDFMTDIAAPVVAGLARADAATQAQIRNDVLALARQSTQDGQVQLRSTATVIVGTR
ncbi:methyltransferase type 11 [Rhizobium sp. R72]|uniref:class I SAM-dependent methyltransferase n=1 Tax=unclassified Rhizobium TaxID=2613769 RepID=UPI000B538886|nr:MULTISPECIES: methyltransferase domain-containing protein [unclassified Rhizobium]OWW04703.1 methyltransferase type 11 [Rhizobium sp. R72]OWW05760.1 methyltransferase type 11 [Rhizobium sp. R711]